MIEKYTQEEFINSDVFEICEEIYTYKYFLEYEFSLEDISNLTFFTYKKDDVIIGFGSYQDNDCFYLVDTNFLEASEYTEYHIELLNHILSELSNDRTICLYQSFEDDYNFYKSLGFGLYKDYGQFFDIGLDYTRYVLEKRV